MKADLHVHSTASDGTLSPTSLVDLALERGLSVLAIADHDSVSGLSEAAAAAEGTSLTLIPAVEFSAALDGFDVHVLAYYVDPTSAALAEELAALRRYRLRARRVDRLGASAKAASRSPSSRSWRCRTGERSAAATSPAHWSSVDMPTRSPRRSSATWAGTAATTARSSRGRRRRSSRPSASPGRCRCLRTRA